MSKRRTPLPQPAVTDVPCPLCGDVTGKHLVSSSTGAGYACPECRSWISVRGLSHYLAPRRRRGA